MSEKTLNQICLVFEDVEVVGYLLNVVFNQLEE